MNQFIYENLSMELAMLVEFENENSKISKVFYNRKKPFSFLCDYSGRVIDMEEFCLHEIKQIDKCERHFLKFKNLQKLIDFNTIFKNEDYFTFLDMYQEYTENKIIEKQPESYYMKKFGLPISISTNFPILSADKPTSIWFKFSRRTIFDYSIGMQPSEFESIIEYRPTTEKDFFV